jgi:hypothetical protein
VTFITCLSKGFLDPKTSIEVRIGRVNEAKITKLTSIKKYAIVRQINAHVCITWNRSHWRRSRSIARTFGNLFTFNAKYPIKRGRALRWFTSSAFVLSGNLRQAVPKSQMFCERRWCCLLITNQSLGSQVLCSFSKFIPKR